MAADTNAATGAGAGMDTRRSTLSPQMAPSLGGDATPALLGESPGVVTDIGEGRAEG